MYGISSSGKESIAIAVERMFDRLAFHLLGNIPKLRDKKLEFFGSQPKFTLANIFLQAMGNKQPNYFEKDVLRSILNSSYGYIEGLKNKTSSNVVEAVDALVKEAKANGTYVTADQVSAIVSAELEKAKNHMKLTAEAETTKTRNMAHTMEIASEAEKQGIEDPTIYFIIVRDGKACFECVRLHMMPDGITPRVYKLSEVSMGYHKRGEDRPSVCGNHPMCRCSSSQLPPGWGFKNGFVSFISLDHDEYQNQRNVE